MVDKKLVLALPRSDEFERLFGRFAEAACSEVVANVEFGVQVGSSSSNACYSCSCRYCDASISGWVKYVSGRFTYTPLVV